ncbi:MAG: zinc ribbon domain-containing protein [Clostridiales bacterium]|nr:zinc ribbon domain-containing protein [Clostridiales bacterium]
MSENNPMNEFEQVTQEIEAEVDAVVETAESIPAIEESIDDVIETAEETVEEVVEEPEEVNPNACLKCGYVLDDEQLFCPKCGTPKGKNPALVCTKCGRDLAPGQEFCAFCGQKVAAPAAESGLQKAFAKVGKAYKGLSKPLQIIIPAVVALLIIAAIVLGIVLGNATVDFREIFPDMVGNKWASFASDGTWMRIDTNPNNLDSDDYSDYTTVLAASGAVNTVNEKLGFPSSIANKMDHTTWSMGRQTESTDKYIVTWTYHPDKGLEVLYEVK